MPTTTTDTDRSPLTPERIQEILAAHREWLRGAGGSRASLYGANLYRADLYSADLSRANLAWQSQDLIAEILRRAAEGNIDRLKVAGLILVKRDWCWPDFVGLGDPLTDWALDTLAAYVQDGDEAPVELRKRAAKTGEVQS